VRRLTVAGREDDVDRLHGSSYRISRCRFYNATPLRPFQTSNKIRIVANELQVFKKPNLTSVNQMNNKLTDSHLMDKLCL